MDRSGNTPPRERILIVDYDPAQGRALARRLEVHGYRTAVEQDGWRALQQVDEGACELLLTDLNLPGMGGMDLFLRVRQRRPDLPVLVVTAPGMIQAAIEAVRDGAADFIRKPIHAEELVHRLQALCRERRLRDENADLNARLLHRDGGDAMEGLRERIRRVSGTGSAVLITGASRTARELVVDALHEGSSRRQGPLVKVDCAAVPDTLLEDDLFGHERGAFPGATGLHHGRFEVAHAGTLFLDEIGAMPIDLQAKLRRVLQKGTFQRLGGSEPIRADVRVVCGTSRDLEEQVAAGRFRADLHSLFQLVPIEVPPVLEAGAEATSPNRSGPRGGGDLVGRLMNSEIAFHEFERELLVRALERTRGNQTRAARMLGMTRRTLQYRIDKFDIDCGAMRG